MLRNTLLFLLIVLGGKGHAQQNYFLLIQADNSQPFYVKMGTKSLSSTAKGRIILAQLKEGSLSISIGFPRQLFPEQTFSMHIDKDQEFQLKDLGEKGWGLFNPQTLELKMPEKKEGAQETKSEGIKKDDAFSRLMAGVVGDTAVMYNTYAMEEALKDSPLVVAAVKKDTMVREKRPADSGGASALKEPPTIGTVSTAPQTNSQVTVKKDTTVVAQTPALKGSVVKLSERKTPKGLRIAFADRSGKKADTIVVIIPMDTTSKTMAAVNQSVKDSSVAQNPHHTDTPKTTTTSSEPPGNHTDTLNVLTKIPERHDSIVHTGSDTIHVYLAPRKKVDSSHLATKSSQDTAHIVTTFIPGPDAAHNAVTRNTVPGARRDTLHRTATGKLKTDTAHNRNITVNRTKPDTLHTNAAARSKPDSLHTATATRPKSDSAHVTSAAKPKSDAASTATARSKPVLVNSDCRNFASDYDVDKLRVKMLEGPKEEDRILAAKKVFKTKCFTTKQIRALSEVFTTDAEKFRFFETAYPSVSDDRFRDLTDLLADPVYNGKFKAMTGQQ